MTDASGDGHLGLVELGEICARRRASDLDLFATLGDLVVTTAHPALQRLLAEAAHRHAWHAELWAQRMPAIPPVDGDRLTDSYRATGRLDPDPIDRYAEIVQRSIAELTGLAGRVDRELDPATHRVIDLVRHDLAEIAGRLAAVRA